MPIVAGAVYALCTPIGMAIGLGIRTNYNPQSATANIVSGILDAISAGILLYTGLVELLAHEFLFNDAMRKAPASKVAFGVICTMLGAGIMASVSFTETLLALRKLTCDAARSLGVKCQISTQFRL